MSEKHDLPIHLSIHRSLSYPPIKPTKPNQTNHPKTSKLTIPIPRHCRAINHDPNVYECPHEFLPERFEIHPLGRRQSSQQAADQDSTRKTMGFGAGRRICPGQHLAENSLVSQTP